MKIVWIVLAIGGIYLLAKKTKKIKDATTPAPIPAPIPAPTPKTKVKSSKSGKVAFLENIDRFKAFLPTLCDGTFNSSDWTDDIIDINNDELIEYWKKVHTSDKAWLRLLASWGLKPDNCISFKAMEVHKKMYVTKDGAEITLGQSYNVIQKCWIQTDSDNHKKVVVLVKVE